MRRFITAVALTALSLAFGLHSGPLAAAAAFDLRATQYCAWNTPGMLAADVSWSAAASSVQQWIDVSDRDNGWAPGTFVSFPLSAGATSVTLPNLLPNSTYYVEIAQAYADGSWDFSPTRVLTTSSCFYVSPRTLPYGAFLDQNPADSPRTITALEASNGTPSVTTTVSKNNNSKSGGTSSGASSTSGSGNKTTCVKTSEGSLVQGPLNAGANATGNVAGC